MGKKILRIISFVSKPGKFITVFKQIYMSLAGTKD